MRCVRQDFDRDVNDLLAFVTDNLPEGWNLDLDFFSGEVSMNLWPPDSTSINDGPSDGDFIDHVLWHVNYARGAEGLGPVEWGSPS